MPQRMPMKTDLSIDQWNYNGGDLVSNPLSGTSTPPQPGCARLLRGMPQQSFETRPMVAKVDNEIMRSQRLGC